MKTKDLGGILLAASGIGIVAYVVWKLLQPKTATTPTGATTGTAGSLDALYKGLGSLFGANKTTDNTGQLITSSASAATGLFNSIKGLWSTGSTPVPSPVNDGIDANLLANAPYDASLNTLDEIQTQSAVLSYIPGWGVAPQTDSQVLEGVNLEAP